MISWLLLVAAGLLEIGWASAIKESHGFTRFWPSVLGIGGALASFALLTLAVRDLPLGTAYAVWVGIGAVGVAVAGVVWFGDTLSPGRVLFLGLIVVGVAGLKFLES
ncbi:quaternary ammonium compound-resistance protein SugE [Actinoalloteichus cyanogriseus DSM 43889]|uniref:Quaternary ammonium compound-resistance protein SugE n=1 Tax=Actinoalloteichus caeruleus DSM 43889 TaxID=1120930 RepID=A0ABT1JEB3_ACTCY|nr:quaternary ammonium compound-resistance protein SugE [Actinoalloteichus caeruleus DSM 43889]